MTSMLVGGALLVFLLVLFSLFFCFERFRSHKHKRTPGSPARLHSRQSTSQPKTPVSSAADSCVFSSFQTVVLVGLSSKHFVHGGFFVMFFFFGAICLCFWALPTAFCRDEVLLLLVVVLCWTILLDMFESF